jgi:hypothetical protein
MVYDEFFLNYFEAFSTVANDMLLKMTYIFIPDSYQQMLQDNAVFNDDGVIQLPSGIVAALATSDIVLNFLTGSSGYSKVRGTIISLIKGNGAKVVHSPCLNDDVLKIILATSFEAVHKDCELMAWGIGNAQTATILTTGPDNKPRELSIKLRSWDNDPFISSGVIAANSWGNVPPGEAFCCPSVADVNGTICINGSVPGYPFKKKEHLCITFSKGRITEWDTIPGSHIEAYFNKLATNAKKNKDENWNVFAELGIGLNPTIRSLTGNPLFDEKMAGTLHIAIGDNIVFGHGIQSHIHEDLVVIKPTLLLDETRAIDNGVVELKSLKNLRKQFTPRPVSNLENRTIQFRQGKIAITPQGIKRKLNSGNRIGYIEIFTPALNKKLVELTKMVPLDKIYDIKYTDLALRTKKHISRKLLNEMLTIFSHYKMATIK